MTNGEQDREEDALADMDPLARMRNFAADAEARSTLAFEQRATRKLCGYFEIALPPRRDDIGLAWFMEQFVKFPVALEARKLKVDIVQLFSAATRSPGWIAFAEMRHEYDDQPIALIVPFKGQGLYVFHNLTGLPQPAGVTRLIRRSKSGRATIVFEPLETFCEAMRARGGIS